MLVTHGSPGPFVPAGTHMFGLSVQLTKQVWFAEQVAVGEAGLHPGKVTSVAASVMAEPPSDAVEQVVPGVIRTVTADTSPFLMVAVVVPLPPRHAVPLSTPTFSVTLPDCVGVKAMDRDFGVVMSNDSGVDAMYVSRVGEVPSSC